MFAILRFETQILDCLAFTFKVIFRQCFPCFSFYGRWIFNGLLQKHLLITPSNLAPDCCYKMYIRSIYIWSKSSFLTLLPLCQEKSCRYFSLISMTVLLYHFKFLWWVAITFGSSIDKLCYLRANYNKNWRKVT